MTVPIVRLGCTTLHPKQAATYWRWARTTGLMKDAACWSPISYAACWADDQAFVNPTTDAACWVDAIRPASQRFCGAFVTTVEGIDDPVVTRDVSTVIGGGGVALPAAVSARGIRISGVLLAADAEAMRFGRDWLDQLAHNTGRWNLGASAGGCDNGTMTVRSWCPDVGGNENDGLYELHGVVTVAGPTYMTDAPCCDTILQFTLDLSATNPGLYTAPALITGTVDPSGWALCQPCPTCGPCRVPVDLTPPGTIAPVTTRLPVAAYDDQGRPSCGPGSGKYLSGAQALWLDPLGRPPYGVGSQSWLDRPEQTPQFDSHGIPSCGAGSGSYGAWAAITVDDASVISNSTTIAPAWTPKTATVSNLSPAQRTGSYYTFALSGSARVRQVSWQLVWRNQFATPAAIVATAPLVVVASITSAGFVFNTVTTPVLTPPIGYSSDVVLMWEEALPSGGAPVVNVTATVPITAATPGVGGGTGTLPIIDAFGRPSCGAGSGNYLTEIATLDSLARPSCGTGSGNYLTEVPTNDDQGRPSCGTGSGVFNSYVGTGAGGDQLDAPYYGTGHFVRTITIPAVALLSSNIFLQLNSNPGQATWQNVTVAYTFTAGPARPAVSLLVGPWSVFPGVLALPIPRPLNSPTVGGVTLTFEFDITSVAGAGWYAQYSYAAVASYAGPNNGTDRVCTVGPNGGSNRTCIVGPNGGVDVSCGGTDVPCAAGVFGPNGGSTRQRITECVSTTKITPVTISANALPAVTGLVRPVNPDLTFGITNDRWSWFGPMHPGSATTSIALLGEAEGAGLPGLVNPLGRALIKLAMGSFVPCDGSVLLGARLVVKLTAPVPPSTSAPWAGWGIFVVDRTGAKFLGGVTGRDKPAVPDADGFMRFTLSATTAADLSQCWVVAQLAAPTGGVGGLLDQAFIETQFVGGVGLRPGVGVTCRECGPNGGVDVACITAATTSTWVKPAATRMTCRTIADPWPTVNTSVIVIKSGSVPLVNAELTVTPNPLGVVCPDADPLQQCDRPLWCTDPCASTRIAWIPANSTLRLDCRTGSVMLTTVDGDELPARHLAPGWRAVGLTTAACVCLRVDNATLDPNLRFEVYDVRRTGSVS